MKYYFKVKVNNEVLDIGINKPELIYGATAIIVNKKIDGYAINPVTKEKMNVFYRKVKENRFFIPSHNNRDYKYAIKNNLPLKQVVAPYFYGKNEEKPRDDKDTQRRYSVVGIIKHYENDMYLCEDAKGRNCKSFVMGGIENGETPIDACKREAYEETGYSDISIDFVSNFKVVNHFYASYKGVNRYAYLNFVYGHLNSDNHKEITDEENAKHIVKWIKKEDLKDFININLNKMALDILLNGEKAFTKDGVMMTNDYNNEKSSKEVRESIIKEYLCSK
ncbi:MAG: NUDIX domain-containing protein [Firmicutes bacterium]|nr:NUDIX domain-containing protein [Bacillota bacterium]